jgi:quercetin dioxygenase-like cupin family protein
MRVRTFLVVVFVDALLAAQLAPQRALPKVSVHEPFIKTAQQNTFTMSPIMPDCYTYTVERGDPKIGPSVTLSKLTPGCKVPWHIHSANAQILFVSGTFQLTMKGQQPQTLMQESYAYVPANHLHQETCLDDCTYYVIRESTADIHYLDEHGKEISPEIALAAVGERPAAASSVPQ